MNGLRKWARYAGLALGGGILIYQIRIGILALQQQPVTVASPMLIVFAFLAMLCAIAFQMFAWSDAMKSLGISLPDQEVLKGYLLSFLPRYIPGTVWGFFSRSEWLYQQYGIDYRVSNQGSIVETLASIVGNVIVIAIFYSGQFAWGFLLVLASLAFPFVIWYGTRLVNRVRLPDIRHLKATVQFLFPEMKLGYWLASVVLFTLLWVMYGLALFLIYRAFGVNTPAFGLESLAWFTSMYAMAWLVGFFVIFAPAGLGFRELALTNLLAAQLGIAMGPATILALVFRMSNLLSEILWLGIGILLKFTTRKAVRAE